ncbi:SGNH/GDSL hydrolase family protein [Kitasatospora sp. NPDC093679]|uniref:SGNH/GDSL hydrolase family protein n=1 Tax=Kitasatospora sp. NPDC093679 TaxID=3154983 RepID=UPI0034211AA5
MRPRFVLSLSGTVLLLASSLFLAAPPAAAATGNYVALGDSYSSGEGTGDYIGSAGSCNRSLHAYPALWASAHSPASFAFVACSGATTADVIDKQLSSVNGATTLVSISVGGNDAGFASAMQTCVLNGTNACLTAVNNAKSFATSKLPALLDQVYAGIRNRAPSARVVVLGYPHLYKIGGSCTFGISDTSRNAINGAADTIDSVIADRAGAAGFAFGDVRQVFTDHEICSSDWWLNSTRVIVHESYHPNATGHANGYLPTFSARA